MEPDVPEGWATSSLHELVPNHRPICYGVLKPGPHDPDGVPLVRIVDLADGEVRLDELHYVSAQLDEEFSRSRLEGGEILLSIQGTIGRVAIVPAELKGGNISRTLARVALDGSSLATYVAQWMRSELGQAAFDEAVVGTTRSSLNIGALRKVRVLLPPLSEQRTIAAILSSVDEAIAATRKVIRQTKRVKQGLLQTLMTRGIGHTRFKKTEIGEIPETWGVVPFASLVTNRILGTTERGEGAESNYQLIKMGNLTWGAIDLSSVEAVRKTGAMRDLELRPGDFLFNTRNTPQLVGKTAVWHGPAGEAIPDNNIMRVRFDDRILPDFVCGQMAHGRGKAHLRRLAAGSTSVAAIYWKDLARYPVALPPVEEQEEMIQALRGIDRQIARCEAVVGSASQTKRGLMQDLLTGRVRVEPD